MIPLLLLQLLLLLPHHTLWRRQPPEIEDVLSSNPGVQPSLTVLPLSMPQMIHIWRHFIEQCQEICPLDSRRGLCKPFPGTIRSNMHPNNKNSDLNPPMCQQIQAFLLMEHLAPTASHNQAMTEWFGYEGL